MKIFFVENVLQRLKFSFTSRVITRVQQLIKLRNLGTAALAFIFYSINNIIFYE